MSSHAFLIVTENVMHILWKYYWIVVEFPYNIKTFLRLRQNENEDNKKITDGCSTVVLLVDGWTDECLRVRWGIEYLTMLITMRRWVTPGMMLRMMTDLNSLKLEAVNFYWWRCWKSYRENCPAYFLGPDFGEFDFLGGRWYAGAITRLSTRHLSPQNFQ